METIPFLDIMYKHVFNYVIDRYDWQNKRKGVNAILETKVSSLTVLDAQKSFNNRGKLFQTRESSDLNPSLGVPEK